MRDRTGDARESDEFEDERENELPQISGDFAPGNQDSPQGHH